ncbi:hypothetical protein CLTEP_27740 [Clostridium tepidiprofundi DSM 19306]|uniref:Uncharacterized protein n=1 Tax=Clostridium tepidiprofundi DSM 19306 TaxID=1121338 RepID=A0A151AK89_9CLOT|nr:hypothetical protein [Clostridium tepidiprofundi]KYH28076.1 hypothetical protein CLTEP_27740 [Clostridium tepidiprofundi DSM 19306]
MEGKILDLLNKLVDGQNEINVRLDRIENKLDSVIEQTAYLTEFRTEVKDFRNEAINQFEEIKDNLNNVEVITASNWRDIAKLKAVK